MQKLRPLCGLLALCWLAGWRTSAQPLYYNTSSSTTTLNRLASVATNGSNPATVLTASGVDGNKLNRCTAMAVDGLNGQLFVLDGAASVLWNFNLNNDTLTKVRSGLTNYPTDLALDVLNGQIYFTTSSTLQSSNTVQRMDYTGSNNVTLFTATGSAGNGVARCTAIAVDLLHSYIFIADAGAKKIWSMSLTGTGLQAIASATNSTPTGLALDVTNQQVYFALGSPAQGSNLIQRVNYNGSGLATVFTASGGVQRCTALDLDPAHATIYLSDAGASTLWRIPSGGGAATSVLNGLTATAKKVRWFSGPATRPSPRITSFELAGASVFFNATNGFVGGTYYVLTTTNLASPLSQWQTISTNVLGASGNFSITATDPAPGLPQQFYLLRVQ